MADARRTGTQSIERTIQVLREICTRRSAGWQLADLAEACGLDKSTAHRILGCLLRERMVCRRENDGHYLPGPLLFEFGLALPGLGAFQREARERLLGFARRTRGVVSLYLRSGDHSVCAVRLGDSTVTGLSSVQAERLPMVVSAGGVAILIALPPEESRAIVARNFAYLTRIGRAHRIDALKRVLKHSQGEGLCVNEQVGMRGVNIFGMAARDARRRPFFSISLAGAPDVFPVARVADFRKLLESEVEALGRMAQAACPEAAHFTM